ncbi:hypothetical protein D9Q98_009265 [Chlorella vulgaris]|uniref:Uncharacterized protein n=1 Tax=Chlorella vulgaris TaxID=3077 RepID=A0A9D4YWW4_CHLVU|nr:hypothetical protein D9Q98_009265 [Chlorella vulgaris]
MLAFAAFVAGITVGTQYGVHTSALVDGARRRFLGPAFATCADIWQGYPLSPVYQVEDLELGKHPIPGLQHVTLHGFRQHGMRGFEVLQQTLAPGVATPVHEHNCQEVFLVLSGQATAAIRGKDGKVVESQIRTNSTFNILPNARHQLVNTGREDLTFIAIIDNLPLRPTFFKSFDDTSAGQTISPMLWDQQCPSAVPDSLRNFVTAPAASDASTEL